jgi:glutamate--cysteine ligase
MSDLGYTSSAQSDLRICYNDLSSYVSTLRRAINLPTKQYESIPAGEGGQWQQLNKNVLQIENELYSPIRPKQVARSLEKPTDALEDRGVSYLEIRSLDVNPFSPVGIQAEQMDFLDVFLLYCLLMPSADYSDELHQESQQNFVDVVLKGREPGLHLLNEGAPVALQDWASNMFKDLAMVADVLDAAQETKRYSTAIVNELAKVHQSETTPSGKWLDTLLDNQIDNSILGMELAKEYKQFIAGLDYRNVQKSDFEAQAVSSLEAQAEIEAADVLSFDKFIEGYFKAAKS